MADVSTSGTIAGTGGLSGLGSVAATKSGSGTIAGAGALAGPALIAATKSPSGTIAGLSVWSGLNPAVVWPDRSGDADVIASGLAQFRHVWIELQVDLGGGLAVIPNSKIGNDLTISESFDAMADEMSFTLVGSEYSPLAQMALTGKRDVVLTINYGGPGATVAFAIFTGVLQSASFDGRACRCVAYDSAAKWIENEPTVDIPPNSGRSRVSVIREILTAADVPVALVDVTPADGGKIAKPVASTDAKLFDLLRDFASPLDTLWWFERGQLFVRNVNRHMTAAPQLALTRQQLAMPLSIEGPETSSPNTIIAAAVKYEPSETVNRTVTTTVETSAVYAPLRRVGLTPYTATLRVVSRVITTTEYLGNLAINTTIDEYAWFAPPVAHMAIVKAGHYSVNGILSTEGQVIQSTDTIVPLIGVFDDYCWEFPDGTFRAEVEETFRLVRRTHTAVELDASNRVTRETTNHYAYRMIEKAPYEVTSGPTLRDNLTYVSDENVGVEPAWAVIGILGEQSYSSGPFGPDETTVTEYTLDADGAITRELVTLSRFGKGITLASTSPIAYGYGIGGSLVYKSLGIETAAADVTTTTTQREIVSEGVYTETESTTNNSNPLAATTATRTGNGALPYAQAVGTDSTSTELSATVSDSLHVAMNGTIVDAQHNEYCESIDELTAFASALLREAVAITVRFDMPLEGLIHKGSVVLPSLPEYGLDGAKKLLVTGVQRNFGAFRQTVTGRYFLPGTLS